MFVKLDHFPRDRGENKKCLKPPPSIQVIMVVLRFRLFSSASPEYDGIRTESTKEPSHDA